jgi:glycosyltransferase involved in cell wall biosynthesis
MIYLTHGNQSHGVYSSYVLANCAYLQEEFSLSVRVMALISIREFLKVRKVRKSIYPNSIHLPLFPGFHRWKINFWILLLLWPFIGDRKVMALSPIATNLALRLKKWGLVDTVIYDGEGATSAEWAEFDVVENETLKKTIFELEEKAVLHSDFRRAVSRKMIGYWQRSFGYSSSGHIVIPCLLNEVFLNPIIPKRYEEVFSEPLTSQVIFVYAGSTAQWQSFDLLEEIMGRLLAEEESFRLLLLCDIPKEDCILYQQFPSQVQIKFVPFEEVPSYLAIADYGLLLRRPSVTNEVAAPTKFAEYLACGLPVLITQGIGDYPDFVLTQQAGVVIDLVDEMDSTLFPKVTPHDKISMRNLALKYFERTHYRDSFEAIVKLVE